MVQHVNNPLPPALPDRNSMTIEALRGAPVNQGPTRTEKLGLLAQMTGDRALSPVGKTLVQTEIEKRNALQKAVEKKRQQDMTKDYYQAQQEQWLAGNELRDKEFDLKNRKFAWQQQQALIDAENQPESKNYAMPPSSLIKSSIEQNVMSKQLGNLQSDFKDSYTRFAAPKTNEFVMEKFGDTAAATKNLREAKNWWSRFKREYDTLKRHELFGATLTKLENESWGGQTINPEMAPEEIKKRISQMQEAIDNTRREAYRTYYELYGPKRAKALIGDLPEFTQGRSEQPAQQTETTPQTQTEKKPGQISIENADEIIRAPGKPTIFRIGNDWYRE